MDEERVLGAICLRTGLGNEAGSNARKPKAGQLSARSAGHRVALQTTRGCLDARRDSGFPPGNGSNTLQGGQRALLPVSCFLILTL